LGTPIQRMGVCARSLAVQRLTSRQIAALKKIGKRLLVGTTGEQFIRRMSPQIDRIGLQFDAMC